MSDTERYFRSEDQAQDHGVGRRTYPRFLGLSVAQLRGADCNRMSVIAPITDRAQIRKATIAAQGSSPGSTLKEEARCLGIEPADRSLSHLREPTSQGCSMSAMVMSAALSTPRAPLRSMVALSIAALPPREVWRITWMRN